MKKIIFGVGLVLMSITGVIAQNNVKSADAKADEQTALMVEQFQLDEDQAAGVKAINLDYFQKEVYVNEKGGGYESIKTLEENRDKGLKSVMSRSQYRKYAAQAKLKYNEEKAVELAKRKDRKAGHHVKLEPNKKTVVN